MSSFVAGRIAWLRSPSGKSMIKYTAVSGISTVVSQVVLWLLFTQWHLFPATVCAAIANGIAMFPAYNLNRRWAWGKKGKSHLWREVVPFWAFSVAGFCMSVALVYVARRAADHFHLTASTTSLVVQIANLSGYGILWVAKFLFFNRLFKVIADHEVGAVDEGDEVPVGAGAAAGVVGGGGGEGGGDLVEAREVLDA